MLAALGCVQRSRPGVAPASRRDATGTVTSRARATSGQPRPAATPCGPFPGLPTPGSSRPTARSTSARPLYGSCGGGDTPTRIVSLRRPAIGSVQKPDSGLVRPHGRDANSSRIQGARVRKRPTSRSRDSSGKTPAREARRRLAERARVARTVPFGGRYRMATHTPFLDLRTSRRRYSC